MSSLKVFNEMKSIWCKPNICTYTALVNAFAREGLCEKAEEVFEEMQRCSRLGVIDKCNVNNVMRKL